MRQYQKLLRNLLLNGGVQYEPRTEMNILTISANLSSYDLRKGFPIVTTKRLPYQLPFEEIFWKARGERNVKTLVDKNVHIWTGNAFDRYVKTNHLLIGISKHDARWKKAFDKYKLKITKDPEFAKTAGDLGPVYGYVLRNTLDPKGENIDQLINLIKGIRSDPGSRYHILSSWDTSRLGEMAIGPCDFWNQFTCVGKFMDLTSVQRSADSFLGIPFNIAQDSLLLKMIANETKYIPRFFNHMTINTHIYLGVPPRSDFWKNPPNVRWFQFEFAKIKKAEGYLSLKQDYLRKTSEEGKDDIGKDHIPFVLEQLSKAPRKLPQVEIKKDISFFEAIKLRVLDYATVNNYNPHVWNSKAWMAV